MRAGGATIDAVTQMGHTPLMVSLDEGQDETAALLLEAGADPSVSDGRGVTPLHIAACRGATEMMNALLRRGARADATSSFGLSPLDLAIYTAPTAGGPPIAGGTISASGAPTVLLPHFQSAMAKSFMKSFRI